MITLFENFTNEFKLSNYIYQDKWEEDGKTGVTFYIPNVSFENLNEYFLDTRNLNLDYFTQIKYNSLMRLFLYVKMLRYKGDNPEILKYSKGVKNKDPESVEIIGKIPNNNGVLKIINQKFNFGFPSYNYDNVTDLKKMIVTIDDVLSDKNLEEYIKSVKEVSDKAKISEKIVKGVVAMLYGRYYDILKAESSEDKKGVDVWMINKENGVRQSIQVKNITGNVSFDIKGDFIYINNSLLDLHNYSSWVEDLPYDHLGFYLENDKKVCIIKAWSIYKIEVQGRTIRIQLKKGAMDNKYDFKMIDIPAKLLPKDYSKIFIDYTKAPARIIKKK